MSLFDDETVKTLYEEIKNNRNENFDFRYKGLTSEEFRNISKALILNTKCKSLVMSGNPIDSDTFAILCDDLALNDSIEKIEFNNMGIMDEDPVINLIRKRNRPVKINMNLGNFGDKTISRAFQAKINEEYKKRWGFIDLNTGSMPSKKMTNSSENEPKIEPKIEPNIETKIETKMEPKMEPKIEIKPKENLTKSKKDEFIDILGFWDGKLPLSVEEIRSHIQMIQDSPKQAIDFIKSIHKKYHESMSDSLTSTKKIIDLKNLQVNEMGKYNYSCSIDGWNCSMRMINISSVEKNDLENFEQEIKKN